MRLRHVGTIGSMLLALGAVAPVAFADSTPGGSTAGGATAPVSATGATGAIGATGATGAAESTTAAPPFQPAVITEPRAPIVLARGESDSLAYAGPVFVQGPGGVIGPYVPPTIVASVSGGTVAGVLAAGPPHLVVPGTRAEVVNGIAAAPEQAPASVKHIIWAANAIIGRPYVYGGGHASFKSEGYDCSGTVSFALHGGHLLKRPMDSSQFMGWGRGGQGQWVTILTNPGHAYLDVAGLRLDTSAADDPSNEQGPRWRPLRPGNDGYKVRHPAGL